MAVQHGSLAYVSAVCTGALGLWLLSAGPAAAYCVAPTHAAVFQLHFPTLRIPVYLSIAANSTIEHTGVSQHDAARILIDVIARHNETAIAPKLYFAGFDTTGFLKKQPQNGNNSFKSWPKGIVIHSAECGLLEPLQNEKLAFVHKDFLCNAHIATGVKACAKHVSNGNMELTGLVSMVPTSCEFVAGGERIWTLDGSGTADLAHVFLHEIGHLLGLQHTNRTPAECMMGGYTPGNLLNPDGNTGAMRTTPGMSLSTFRHWRRDDLDGLDYLWGGHYPSYELAYWSDDGFPDFPDLPSGSSLSSLSVIRSASVADTPPNQPQALVSLDDSRHVMFAILGADDSVAEAPTMIDPGPLGITAGSPEIALGDDGAGERVFVAWTSNEQPDSELMQARWALRELAGGPWTLAEGFDLATPRVVAGFDPLSGNWLLGTLATNGEPLLSVIDFDGALQLEAAPLGPVRAYDIGDLVCGHGWGCSMLFSTSALGGPSLGRLELTVSTNPAAVFVDSTSVFSGQDVYGRMSLAPSAPGLLRGVAGPQRFELDTETNAPLDPVNPPSFSARDWPLGLGSYTDDQAALNHRLVVPLEVECGNGVLQATEQCDDGNVVPGDGCDDLCMIESETGEPGGGGGTGGTGETGGFLIEGEGCECGVERGGDARRGGIGLILLGLSAWAAAIRGRRRRRFVAGARLSEASSLARF